MYFHKSSDEAGEPFSTACESASNPIRKKGTDHENYVFE
jgi:hypothetical protein